MANLFDSLRTTLRGLTSSLGFGSGGRAKAPARSSKTSKTGAKRPKAKKPDGKSGGKKPGKKKARPDPAMRVEAPGSSDGKAAGKSGKKKTTTSTGRKKKAKPHPDAAEAVRLGPKRDKDAAKEPAAKAPSSKAGQAKKTKKAKKTGKPRNTDAAKVPRQSGRKPWLLRLFESKSPSGDMALAVGKGGKAKAAPKKRRKARAEMSPDGIAITVSGSGTRADGKKDRRLAYRVPLVGYKVRSPELPAPCKAKDISATGMGIVLDGPRIKGGTVLTLNIKGPEAPALSKVRCKVMRHERGVVGCKFLELSNEQDDIIGKILLLEQKRQAERRRAKAARKKAGG